MESFPPPISYLAQILPARFKYLSVSPAACKLAASRPQASSRWLRWVLQDLFSPAHFRTLRHRRSVTGAPIGRPGAFSSSAPRLFECSCDTAGWPDVPIGGGGLLSFASPRLLERPDSHGACVELGGDGAGGGRTTSGP
ncbi:Hypothetical predicted protein [Podarcis lilfordi]|uniref:Uncharacterized protein n=1 Tax=Podarcis lilfordi TaxID=74358 RepID=A0AA35LLF6_9SAUR|nr:Hypothetical predicted protein [Podarcis lilfordi]